MKLAIIAPHDLLDLTNLVDEYHLILPQELDADENYMRFYQDVNGYKILDNGEAEGITTPPIRLLNLAHEVEADEIVVPDVIGSFWETVDRVRDFFKIAPKNNDDFKYMGVVQGHDLASILSCVYYYADMPWITTLGIPRWITKLHKMQRITLIEGLKTGDLFDRFEIHALGASPWIREVVALSETGIRGMDTSLPVVLGIDSQPIKEAEYINRQSNYFDIQLDRRSYAWKVAYDNVRTYLEWAGVNLTSGEEAPSSEV